MTFREARRWQLRNGIHCEGGWYATRWALWWRLGWRWLYPGRAL